ncbi:hypothetical protein B296_00026524 [Ensete ventricosum]|uniref:Uncharacterized protein n=1 Tax=Ensete ventricosum TaxID=4639 RepID=A0A426ZYR7_ENSVE|nr:hypothetical protein B296_00026524 [Ensete ventricosum]
MLGTKSPSVRLGARLEMLGTESPWVSLRAHLEMLGTERPWARLRARFEMLETESPWGLWIDRCCLVVNDPGVANALVAMRSFFNVDSSVDRCPRGGPKVLATPCDRDVPQRVANVPFPDGAQLMALSGGFLVGMIWLRVKELEEGANKLRAKPESLKSQRRDLEQEVRVLRPSLDEARNDRARLEGDVLSLTEAMTLLKAELKAKGPRAVAAYKASRGFESGLEKMGRVSYEFGYRVALERLRRKYSKITIEQDPFAKCPDDANIEMDLNQPFGDNTPSKK